MPADIRAALPRLIAFEKRRASPVGADELSALLTGMLALIGGRMTQDERVQWQVVMGIELRAIPADLTREALQSARRRCEHPAKVLPFVWEFVGDLPERRRAAVQRLELLASLAVAP